MIPISQVSLGVDDLTLKPASATERITEATRVLLPVHLCGQMADMTALGGEVLSLPVHDSLSGSDVDRVIDAIGRALETA